MKTVGIFGGGQLGSMLSHSLFKLDANVAVFDENTQTPCSRQVNLFFGEKYNDLEKLKEFNKLTDIITYEFENIPYDTIAFFKDKCLPNADVLKICQNRIYEKDFLAQNDLPIVNYLTVGKFADLDKINNSLNFPFIIKSASGGYDGKSQFIINDESEFNICKTNLKNKPGFFPCIVEEKVDLYKEVSLIIGRSISGKIINYPIIENFHKQNVLAYSVYPAQIDNTIHKKIVEYGHKLVKAINLTGLIVIELFLSKELDNIKIYINELAPRPHNSGHLTIKAFNYSQFDLLAKILLQLPVYKPKFILNGSVCMVNIFGDSYLNSKSGNLNLNDCFKCSNLIDFNLYGKLKPASARKMGHLTVLSENNQTAINLGLNLLNSLSS